MAVSLCGYNGCRNPVRSDATRCWRHLEEPAQSGGGEYAADAAREALATIEGAGGAFLAPPSGERSPRMAGEELLVAHTSIDPALAAPVMEAVEQLKQRASLTIPAEAYLAEEQLLDTFLQELQGAGVAKQRISVLRLSGMHRRTMNGREQYGEGVVHHVVVLDGDTTSEVVVDPFIAALAPVRNQRREVDEQLPSGVTPFGDLPWVGTREEYIMGDYLWWEHSEALYLP